MKGFLLCSLLLFLAGCSLGRLLSPGGVLNPAASSAPAAPIAEPDRCSSATTAAECDACAAILSKETAVLSADQVQRALTACKARVYGPSPSAYWIGTDADCAITSDGERYGEVCPSLLWDPETLTAWICDHQRSAQEISAGGSCVSCGEPTNCFESSRAGSAATVESR